MFSKALVTAFAATLIASANAHMAIQQPPPIPGSDSKSPLDPSGSNFPCQGASLTGGTVTNLVAGQSQGIQFNLGQGANTAVHGGGSCQISITYETDPAKLKDPNNWKVLHSFIGGCPTEAMGNLDQAVACSGSNTNCVNQGFSFQVPSEVQNGNGILAWTWFNNIGNREMYMNCAKVSVSGGQSQLSSLPSMFAANIGNGCSTTEQFNTDFPNPGKYVTKSTLNYPLKAPVGSCQSGAGSASIPSTGGNNGGSSASSVAPAAPATTSQAPKQAGGAFAEGASSVAAPAAATTLATVASAAPALSSAQPAAPAQPANGSQGACSAGQVSCSASGFYCIDSTHFGMCAWGCATPMAVSAGTTCSGGAITAAKEKRHLHIRHARRGLLISSQ